MEKVFQSERFDMFNTIELDFNLEVLEVESVSVSTSKGKVSLIICYRSPTGNNNYC